MQPIIIGNFEATQDEKGSWIYKAAESKPLAKKGKPQYREKPQYPLQETIEGKSKKNFAKVLSKTVLETVSFIKDNLQ